MVVVSSSAQDHGCLDTNDAVGVAEDRISTTHRERLAQHLARCGACRELVLIADSAATGAAAAASTHDVDDPARYELAEFLGEGAHGHVYRAHDRVLGRDVALKFVRGHGTDERILAEARAMAALSHPNILPVFDAVRVGKSIAIAMELAPGGTLASWLEHHRDDPRRVLAMFRQIASGIAAAHAAGIVHGDLKPANILVAAADRPMVGDFGLALARELTDEPTRDPAPPTLVGTPAYMAPELFDGGTPDERSDQYSFCIALYEAAYGARPHVGDTMASLRRARAGAAVPEFPRRRSVPARLRRVLARGLARDPEARWPDMHAVAVALAPGRARPLALATGLVGFGVTLGTLAATGPAIEPCDRGLATIDEVWNEERRGRVDAVLAGDMDASARVLNAIDGWVDDWRAAYGEACGAALDRVEPVIRCLDDRRARLHAQVDVLLETSDPVVLSRALDAVLEVPVPEQCQDPGLIGDVVFERSEDDALPTAAVDWAEAHFRLGQYDDAERAAPTREAIDALALGDPTRARAQLLRSRIARELGHRAEAQTWAILAARASTSAGRRADEIEAWLWLAFLAVDARRGEDAARYLEVADVALAELPRASELMMQRRDEVAGGVFFAQERFAEAAEAYRRALASRLASGQHHDPGLVSLHGNASACAWRLGDLAGAREHQLAALAIMDEVFGPDHPRAAREHENAAAGLANQGELARARVHYETSLRILERHPHLTLQRAKAQRGLGEVLLRLGLPADAESLLRSALAVRLAAGGASDADTLVDRAVLGGILIDLGRDAEARRELALVLRDNQARLEPLPRIEESVLGNLVLLDLRDGEFERAERTSRRLVELARTIYGDRHPRVGDALHNLGETLIERGQLTDAIASFEAALEVYEQAGAQPPMLAPTWFSLAQGLRMNGGDRRRAADLATRAREAFATDGGPDAVAAVDAWLREEGGR